MTARGGVLVIFLVVLLKSLDESLRKEEFISAHWSRVQSVMVGDRSRSVRQLAMLHTQSGSRE